ncbi:toll-like receptor 4 [Saccostrea echinata]|uniref:toll-like receptor 4 n=1 Tax=Saccostrea echinata TaxID=191078 RepID=UPI002A82ECF7|nr:toll-like receptor 4 [Saccostrea echinata]
MDELTFLWLIFITVVIEAHCKPNSNCSSIGSCNCYEVNGYIHADCSRRLLSVAPLLREDVVSIDFRGNLFHTFPNNLSENIRYLNLAENLINKIEEATNFSNASLQNLINLENLTLSNNKLNVIEKGVVRYTKKLRHLDLSYNVELSLSILENLTYGMRYTDIKVLNLEKVQCTYGLSKELSIHQVRNLSDTALEELNIASNRINVFQFRMLSVLPKTLRKLNVADNVLGVGAYLWTFGQLSSLQILNASFQSSFHNIKDFDFNVYCHENEGYEQVTSLFPLPQGNRITEVKYTDTEFDLVQRNAKNIRFLNLDKYTCLFQNATSQEFGNFSRLMKQLEKECSSYTLIIAITSSLLLVFVTIVMSRIIHRYRWKLRYMYFVARGKNKNQKISSKQTEHSKYHFDAFISYANNDEAFVVGLVKHLEETFRLRLCLHQRDFIPGTDIADNIINAIHISKRTVCILTSHYLKSYWCIYEMNMARMEAVYSRNGSNVLFFVILQKSVVKELPWKWMDLIESKSYMDLAGDGEQDLSVFRTKLAETLLAEEY